MATRKGRSRTKKSETSTKSASKRVKAKGTGAKAETKKVEAVIEAESKKADAAVKIESKKSEQKNVAVAAKVEPKKAASATAKEETGKGVSAAREDEKKTLPTAKEEVKEPVLSAKSEPDAKADPKKPAIKGEEKKTVPDTKTESDAKEEPKKPVAVKSAAKVEEKKAPAEAELKKAKAAVETEPEKTESSAAEEKAAFKSSKPKEKETEPAAKTEEKKPEPAPKAEEKKPEPAAKTEEKKPEPAPKAEEKKPEPAAKTEEKKPEPAAKTEEKNPEPAAKTEEKKPEPAPELPQPRRSVAFIGSECYPFVKTGGLGDVMSALPKALVAQNIDVHVILPRYKCIKEEWQNKMIYKGSFEMDLCSDGKSYYVGIMEYVHDGVVYDFIDNEDFFSWGNPYTNLVDDIPKFCYFDKAALAALNYMNWIPDVIHCHDWQAGLVPLYLREMFNTTPLAHSKVIITIHNLRFQGVYNIPTIKYWTNLPDYVFNKDVMSQEWTEANMLKGGMTYSNMITTVSNTYAQEIQTPEYGEGLDAHLRYHSGKLRGIVNGIDTQMWDPSSDKLLEADYTAEDVLEKKKINKLKLQEELGLEQDENKFVIGLISRLTDQKGLDLVNAIMPQIIDGNTQFVVLGTGEPQYEDSFRYYENTNKGTVCSNIMYDEGRAHKIYAGADALLVPSRFEPCGLTQLISMHYGTIPIVRETGGLKDTVLPYNQYTNEGNGFTFDRYESGLLLDAINRAKTVYFTNREHWDDMIVRDMKKDVSWNVSAKQYRQLYLDLTQ